MRRLRDRLSPARLRPARTNVLRPDRRGSLPQATPPRTWPTGLDAVTTPTIPRSSRLSPCGPAWTSLESSMRSRSSSGSAARRTPCDRHFHRQPVPSGTRAAIAACTSGPRFGPSPASSTPTIQDMGDSVRCIRPGRPISCSADRSRKRGEANRACRQHLSQDH